MVQQAVNKCLIVGLLGLSLMGYSQVEAGSDTLAARLAMAQQKYVDVQRLGFAWRANRVALDNARRALNANKPDEAHRFIEEALRLAEASRLQAERESLDWQSRPPFGGG